MASSRTYLFTPANNEKRVSKAFGLNADAVILDLEDAVALSEKAQAREMAGSVLRPGRNSNASHRVYVRINSTGSGLWRKDLESVVHDGLDGIMLPKSESAADVWQVEETLSEIERARGLPEGSIELIPLVESARGIWNAYEIASTSRRVACLAFGAIDFTLDIGINYSKGGAELLYARSQLVVASRAAGVLPPVDTVFPDIRDFEGLIAETKAVKQLGFFGKLVIHPNQIEPVNRIFAPTEAEVERARRVVEAFAKAEAQGNAAIQLDGQLVDYPVAHRARKILALAETLPNETFPNVQNIGEGGPRIGTASGKSE